VALIAAVALAAAATQAPALLAPVLDRPYRLVFEDERNGPDGIQHFRIERTVVFKSEPEGFRADVTLVDVRTDASGEIGRRFLMATGALRNRTVTFHLSPDGSVRAIDDEAAVWSAIVAGVAAIAPQAGGENTPGRHPDGPLATLPPDAVRATLASILSPMLAGSDAGLSPGTRAVTLPRSTLAPGGASLPATEVATLTPEGPLSLRVQAQDNGPAVRHSIDRLRVVDRAHGLVILRDDRRSTTTAGLTQLTRSRMQVIAPVF